MTPDEYRCEACGEVFQKGWTDEEAKAEQKEQFGDLTPENIAVVCDECYKKMGLGPASTEDAERIRQAKDGDVVELLSEHAKKSKEKLVEHLEAIAGKPMTEPFTQVHLKTLCEQVGQIPVPRDQLMQLIELAEDSIYTSESEFSNPPTDEERGLMLSLYRLVGKEVPPFFVRNFGWKLEKPDGSS